MAHLMKRSHDPTLDHRPKSFNGIGMDRAVDILACAVVDHAMRETGIESAIASVIVGREQTDLVRDRFVYELGKRARINAVYDARNDVVLALHCTDIDCLAVPACAAEVASPARSLVLVLGLPADIGFVYFDV